MKTKITSLVLFLICLAIGTTYAQDQIHKKSKEVINCKVREIGLDEVKYNLLPPNDEILFSISKDKVHKIIFEGNEEIIFKDEFNNAENYLDNKKNAIKIDFMSPLTGNTTFAYERSLQPGRSFEVTLGFIGLGSDPNDENPAGFFSKFGFKFIKSPDYYIRGMKYAHILKGGYAKPEIAFGYYAKDVTQYDYYGYSTTTTKTREQVLTGALFINLGKQWIYDNVFLIDIFGGIGYGFGSDSADGGYQYGYVVGSSGTPIAFQAGFKIGFLFR